MDINQLVPDLMPQPSDLLPIWSTNQGLTRKVPISSLTALIESNLTVPGGVLSMATLSLMRARPATPITQALTATPTPINPFQIGVQNPPATSSSALVYDLINGRFVAQRTIALAQFNFSLLGTWASGVNLTLQLWTGPQNGTPFVLTPGYVDIGTATERPASFSGIIGNPNNLNNVINAGDQIQIAAALSTPGNLTINSVVLDVMTLDGV